MDNIRRTASRRSSRSRSDNPPLHRLLSSHHPDDHSVYHHEDSEGVHVRENTSSLHKTETQRRDVESSSSDDSASSTREKRSEDEAEDDNETTYEEIRGGIPYEHDVEAGKPELEKRKSNRSIKDPNLVSLENLKIVIARTDKVRSHGSHPTTLQIPRTGLSGVNGPPRSSCPALRSFRQSPHR